MREDRLNELLERCDSPIERQLLENLYPHLVTDRTRELCAQYKIDRYPDIPVTIPDFAFPDIQIAIYCDGFKSNDGDREKFRRSRMQSRELQLRGWIVLRFAGSEIYSDGKMVTDTIQRAIARRERQRAWWDKQRPQTLELHSGQERLELGFDQAQQKPKGGMCGVVFLASIIVGILVFVLLNFIF